MSKHPGPDRLAGMIRDELAVGDDSQYATPEACREALRVLLDIPRLTNNGAIYNIGYALGLIKRSADE